MKVLGLHIMDASEKMKSVEQADSEITQSIVVQEKVTKEDFKRGYNEITINAEILCGLLKREEKESNKDNDFLKTKLFDILFTWTDGGMTIEQIIKQIISSCHHSLENSKKMSKMKVKKI